MNWITIGLTAFLTTSVCFSAHEIDVYFIKKGQETALANQATALKTHCAAQEATTQGVDNALQKLNTDSNAAYVNALSLLDRKDQRPRPTTCPGFSLAAARTEGLYCTDPPGFRRLIGRLNKAELQTNRLIECQSLLTKEREPN
jgi:hypothetical protein